MQMQIKMRLYDDTEGAAMDTLPTRLTDDGLAALTAFRHDLHRNPELSGQERRTTARIREFLLALPECQIVDMPIETGVVARIPGTQGEVMLRADIEALQEKCTPELKAAIDWALEAGKSPFEKEGYAKSYYKESEELLKKSKDILATGKQDNLNSDRYGLVTVIYSLVLFLLGIAGTFKHSPNRIGIVSTAVLMLVIGSILMFSIPMPAGFDLFHFLGGN